MQNLLQPTIETKANNGQKTGILTLPSELTQALLQHLWELLNLANE